MKKQILNPNWYFIDGKFHHCIAIYNEKTNMIEHYVDGKFTHSVNNEVVIKTSYSNHELKPNAVKSIYEKEIMKFDGVSDFSCP